MPPASDPTSKMKSAYPYDANIYNFAVNMWKESKQRGSDADLLTADKAYDAMSISISAEKLRKLSANSKSSNWDKFSNSSWYNAFNNLCGARCNLLSFELLDTSQKPVVNQFLYRLNQSASFNNTLEKPKALASMRLRSPTQLTEVYYECTLTPISALQVATGLAMGNAALYSRLLWLVVLNIIVCFIIFYEKQEVLTPIQVTERESKTKKENDQDIKRNIKFLAEVRN